MQYSHLMYQLIRLNILKTFETKLVQVYSRSVLTVELYAGSIKTLLYCKVYCAETVVVAHICHNNGLFDLAATAGLDAQSTYILHIEPKYKKNNKI